MKSPKIINIAALITSLFLNIPSSLAEKLPLVILKKRCDNCHGFDLRSKKNLAPNLRYAGEKFQSKWLESYLKKPEIIRPSGYILSPKFLEGNPPDQHLEVSVKEAKIITNYLMTLKVNSNDSPIIFETLPENNMEKTKIKFERNFGCTSCHQSINLVGKARGGVSGPSLVNAGNRLNPAWIYRWLKNPSTYEIKSRMPIFKITEETSIELVKYIMTLKRENLK